ALRPATTTAASHRSLHLNPLDLHRCCSPPCSASLPQPSVATTAVSTPAASTPPPSCSASAAAVVGCHHRSLNTVARRLLPWVTIVATVVCQPWCSHLTQ
ncbi:unnamed protein product, partial [Musa acuminata subsp. burmannicoides]